MTSVTTSPLDPSAEVSLAQAAEAGGRFPALDGLRGLAALGVIATHAGFQTARALDDGPIAPWLARLDYGVTVFFLLSGFLLYRPFVLAAAHARPAPSVRRYATRRLLRIVPAYWLLLIATFLAIPANRELPLSTPLLHALFAHTYPTGHRVSELGQAWTLVVEMAFYVMLPLLALVLRPVGRGSRVDPLRRTAVLAAAMVVTTYAFALTVRWSGVDDDTVLLWLPAYLDWFALGMLAAAIQVHVSRTDARGWAHAVAAAGRAPLACWAIALCVFWLATLPLAGPRNLAAATTWEWTFKHVLYAVSAAFLLLPAVFPHGHPLAAFLGSRPMRFLGTISYGVYLWHLFVMYFVVRWLGYDIFQGRFLSVYMLTALGTVVLATVSYYGLERPLLRLPRVRSRRRH